MQNELHDRLEYLVNYSSQLIFVSGDSIANQQRTLETFVYQQHDDTEIAYLTADAEMDISDYRRQLCRQLLGQVVGSFVRPLNELLSELNTHEGPVMIALTQAQHMPDALLQELWDLVLQSRFAGNKQHLNVLLFGESAWAERAKQWLPSKNTDTPLLISSQSVHTEPGGSELDRLIARRREEFQAHLANRASQSSLPTLNRVSSRWFIALMAVILLVVFGALVNWQYGPEIRQLFAPIKTPAGQDNSVAPGDAYSELLDEASDVTPEGTGENNRTADALAAQPDALVASWPSSASEETQTHTAAEGKAASPQSQQREEDLQSSVPPVSETVEAKKDNDGAVTLASKDAPRDLNTVSESEAVTPPVPETVVENPATPSQPVNETSRTSRASEPEMLLDKVQAEDFFIQMAGLSDRALLAQFIRDNQLTELTHVYRTYRYGGDWFVVLFHQPFGNAQQARAAMRQLPDYQGRDKAFVKAGTQILEELNTLR
ncbi:SPOR domain-containing protein [Alteromonas halophila]|uniref:SPOR domain-containing protein n=1 Tax=Alteromonas halophila TaxID=516698 RepID=A0A918MW93_9ALTE|nr:SPOR domain-containing protein [Alteromonas halophila]GGW78839.1 hypothetical protein GCM10007391_09340 [Alteromonas halophila]